jgi:hypothetical protein
MNSFYNMGEKVDVARPPSDAYLVLDSADRSTSSSATSLAFGPPPTQPYNNFRLQKPENLIQGGFTRLQLTEVNFPYAIPNVNERNNQFWILAQVGPTQYIAQIIVPEGTYAGNELAFVLLGLMNLDAVIGTAITGITWSVQYSPVATTFGRNGFVMAGAGVGFTGFALFPLNPVLIPTTTTAQLPLKTLLDVLGFNTLSNWGYITQLAVQKISSWAPLTYTKYIDIASSKLTYYANVKDSSTKTGSGAGIICRLYISNETSDYSIGYFYNGTTPVKYTATPPAGSEPFMIHRQYMSPKQFKWDKETAVDWIDIQLLDDVGQPLYVPSQGLPDFQITFKATED